MDYVNNMKHNKKKILCFGDSNTYGFNPINAQRYNKDTRWTGILQTSLKEKYDVIEAGFNNRTCFMDNPEGEELTGYKAIKKYLSNETDILILALGINDLQKIYHHNEETIKNGLAKIIDIANDINKNVQIIILVPSIITADIYNGFFCQLFDEQSIEESKKLNNIYQNIAKEKNCTIINLNDFVNVSSIDGIHYDENAHKTIAKILQDYFLNLT